MSGYKNKCTHVGLALLYHYCHSMTNILKQYTHTVPKNPMADVAPTKYQGNKCLTQVARPGLAQGIITVFLDC